jgi:hypothetical protein
MHERWLSVHARRVPETFEQLAADPVARWVTAKCLASS